MIAQDWVPFDIQENALQYHKLPPGVCLHSHIVILPYQ